MSLHSLSEVRGLLPEALDACISKASADAIHVVVAAAGAGKTTAAMSVAAKAHANGQGVCIAFPSRGLRDEMAEAWSARNREKDWALGSPTVVRSVAEKCGVGERFNHLIAAGYAERRDPEDSLHAVVCIDGKDCNYRGHLEEIAAAAEAKRPLLCTHAWLSSPLAQELLTEYGYVVLVDEAHKLIEQDVIDVPKLRPYLGGAATAWDTWAEPCGLLASVLIEVMKQHAEDGRAAATAQRAKRRAADKPWHPRPFAVADVDLTSWLLPRVDQDEFNNAVTTAAAVQDPPPTPPRGDEIDDAWLPSIAAHLAALLDGRAPAEAGAALTARLTVRNGEDDALEATSSLVWTRWGHRLPHYRLVLMDATGHLSERAVRAAYPDREVHFHEFLVCMPGPSEGLYAVWLPTKSLRAVNLRNRHGKLSRRGQGAARQVLLAAIRAAHDRIGGPLRVGFIGPQYVAGAIKSVPLAAGKADSEKFVESLIKTGQIESFRAGYFGNLRGTNQMEDCNVLVLFGDPIPNLANTTDEAAVLGVCHNGLLTDLMLQEAQQALGRGRPLDVSLASALLLLRAGRFADYERPLDLDDPVAAEPGASIQWERHDDLPGHRPRSEDRKHVEGFVAELLEVGPASPLIARSVLAALAGAATEQHHKGIPMCVCALLAARDSGTKNTFLEVESGREVFREAAQGLGAAGQALKLTPGRGRPTVVWALALEDCAAWSAAYLPNDLTGGVADLAEKLLQRWRVIPRRTE